MEGAEKKERVQSSNPKMDIPFFLPRLVLNVFFQLAAKNRASIMLLSTKVIFLCTTYPSKSPTRVGRATSTQACVVLTHSLVLD